MKDKPFHRYILENIKNVSFQDSDLKPSRNNETETEYKVKAIIGKKKSKGKIYYLIWWKGYKKNEATYELEEDLIHDGLENLINNYNNA